MKPHSKRYFLKSLTLGEEISKLEQQTDNALLSRDKIRMTIPNLLHSEVPEGADEIRQYYTQ